MPHPSCCRWAQRDMTQAQQEEVIRAGKGYGDAVILGDDQRCFISGHKYVAVVFSSIST